MVRWRFLTPFEETTAAMQKCPKWHFGPLLLSAIKCTSPYTAGKVIDFLNESDTELRWLQSQCPGVWLRQCNGWSLDDESFVALYLGSSIHSSMHNVTGIQNQLYVILVKLVFTCQLKANLITSKSWQQHLKESCLLLLVCGTILNIPSK